MCLGDDTLLLCMYRSGIDPKNPTALDPNYKVAYAEEKWVDKYFQIGKKSLENMVRTLLSPLCYCNNRNSF